MIELLNSGNNEVALTGYSLEEMLTIGDAIEREHSLPYPQRVVFYGNSQAFFFELDLSGEVIRQVHSWLVGKEHSVKYGMGPYRNQTKPSHSASSANASHHPPQHHSARVARSR